MKPARKETKQYRATKILKEDDDRELTVTGMRASELLAESSDEEEKSSTVQTGEFGEKQNKRDSNELRVSALLRETEYDK